jgi:NAD(P)-dependent dehydrogenase (short-subunit alcohol dehydrogenase family)
MSDPMIALVTGANKGIGREIAAQLAQLGHTVITGSSAPGAGPAPHPVPEQVGTDHPCHRARRDEELPVRELLNPSTCHVCFRTGEQPALGARER